MLLCQADSRPAHLSRVHAALLALADIDRRHLGVVVDWRGGPHTLSYRQVEYTFSLVCAALGKDMPDGTPTNHFQAVLDALVEASVDPEHKAASSSLAVDWTDVESFSTRRTKHTGRYADAEAAWGHRKGGGPGEKDELFFGYYLSLATMVADEGGPGGPELVRRMNLVSCDHDPVPAMVGVIESMPTSGVNLGDIVADSGYAHRVPAHFALPLRAAGASLVMDLHPADRGTHGTHHGAIACNGNLYCPATPTALFDLGPLTRGASEADIRAHDTRASELARHKLSPVSATDTDGYQRVACPATVGKLRCPLRPASLTLGYDRPEVTAPPEHPPLCCNQQTITVPPAVNAKTAQKHDYPAKTWRRSYARRSAAERSNARIKDPASIDVARGWCRVMGLVPMSLFIACALVVRNLAVADAFNERQTQDARRAASGLAPRARRRRRQALSDLDAAGANTPP
ncbi:MAG: hypothetical protein ACYC1D_06135 [Acidimicrobiales bacterium]